MIFPDAEETHDEGESDAFPGICVAVATGEARASSGSVERATVSAGIVSVESVVLASDAPETDEQASVSANGGPGIGGATDVAVIDAPETDVAIWRESAGVRPGNGRAIGVLAASERCPPS